ncbi:hypothetical protein NDU88_005573 [Pleurodeles waltl]|uniref:Uncharacterized protein n=1 Tax=Pleurodeles waltl TaxID=8319 RepID=A0AAV7WYP4_PLEWA|nr:hypothetical protein NDU88_005573 [Pleurodeles waltl]
MPGCHGDESVLQRQLRGAGKREALILVIEINSTSINFGLTWLYYHRVQVGAKRCRQGGGGILESGIIIIIDSEEEREIEEVEGLSGKGHFQQSEASERAGGSRSLQWVPRVVSPMVRRVQEWEVANKSVFRAGEQVEFVDEQGAVLRGIISGVTRDDGRSASAQLRLDFWQQGVRAYLSGCNNPHVPERHGLASEGQRFGQPAYFSVPVEVRAPPAHRFEERAQSGAVRPTARETPVHDIESLDPFLRDTRVIPASRSTSSGLVPEEEELDYEDEVPVLDVRAVSAPKTVLSGQAVQGDRLSSQPELVGGLRRGCYGTHSFRIGAAMEARALGKSDGFIMGLGRWKSQCFNRYAR